MLNITRRQLCKAAGVGAAALAISPLAACAGGGNEPVMSDAATDTPAPAPAETEPEGGYPNGTPSTLFGAPGKHAWFYGDAPSKGGKAEPTGVRGRSCHVLQLALFPVVARE